MASDSVRPVRRDEAWWAAARIAHLASLSTSDAAEANSSVDRPGRVRELYGMTPESAVRFMERAYARRSMVESAVETTTVADSSGVAAPVVPVQSWLPSGSIKPVSLERGLGAPDPKTEEERARVAQADREHWEQRAEQARIMQEQAQQNQQNQVQPAQYPVQNQSPPSNGTAPNNIPVQAQPATTNPGQQQPPATPDQPADNKQQEPTIPVQGPADRTALEGLKPGETRVLPSGVTATAGHDGTTSFATVDPTTGNITTKTFDKYWSWVATAESVVVPDTGGLSRDTTITGRYGNSEVRSVDDGAGNIITWTRNPDGSHSVQYSDGLIVKEPAPGSSVRPEVVQLSEDGLSGISVSLDANGKEVWSEFGPSPLGSIITRYFEPDPDPAKPGQTTAVVLTVPGPEGLYSIVEGPNGTTVIDPDGTTTPVNSRFIAPPRRTHANRMFDASLGRWVHPPADTPEGLTPEKSVPSWVYATGPAQVIDRPDSTIEVRLPMGGSDGGDRPWTDVRVLDVNGRELAHYSEAANGDRTYRLGLDHAVTIDSNGNVVPPKSARSPLDNVRDYNRADGSITYTEFNTQLTNLPRIALPPGVPGKGLYAHDNRLIIQTDDGKFYWVDATPELLPTLLPAERSIYRPWDYRDADGKPIQSFQDRDQNFHFNVNGHEVVFTPDLRQVVDPPNSLRPSGPAGIYVDDRGPGGFPIGATRLDIPEGVPAIGLWRLDDGRLVIQDREGGSHYVSPLPAPAPQSLGQALSGLALTLAGAVNPGGRGGGANRPRIDTLPRPADLGITFGGGKPTVSVAPKPTLTEQTSGLPSSGRPNSKTPAKPSLGDRSGQTESSVTGRGDTHRVSPPDETVSTPRRPDQTTRLDTETVVRAEDGGTPRLPTTGAGPSRVVPSDPTPPEPASGSGGGGGGGRNPGGNRSADDDGGDYEPWSAIPSGPFRFGGGRSYFDEVTHTPWPPETLPWSDVVRYAKMAQDVYNRGSTAVIDGFQRVPDGEILQVLRGQHDFSSSNGSITTKSGMVASLYRNADGELVLAYKGTTPTKWSDLKADIRQATKGDSAMYRDAWRLAFAVQEAFPSQKIVVVGHSLGGGLAGTGVLVTTGTLGVTFNAAGVHNNYVRLFTGRDPDEVRAEFATTGRIRNYVVSGEVLTSTQQGRMLARVIRLARRRYGPDSFPEALGRTIVLEPAAPANAVTLHLMKSVLAALYRYLEDNDDGSP